MNICVSDKKFLKSLDISIIIYHINYRAYISQNDNFPRSGRYYKKIRIIPKKGRQTMKFGKDFIWGAASSAYQVEGGAKEGGRTSSIWDVFSHEEGKIFGGHTGDTACDAYHRFEEDVALMKEIGLKAYRFSISWSRVIPSRDGKINEEGLGYYSRLVDALKENNIEPYITLYHWDMPYWVYKMGGWLNEDVIDLFAEYAGSVVERLSDRVEHFITFNGPQCFIGMGFLNGEYAPGLKCPRKDIFEMCHNVLKAHGKAVLAMRARAKQPIKIGYAPTATMMIPDSETPADIEAARKRLFSCPDVSDYFTWNVSWWSDPIILGEYPTYGLEKYREYLPEITPDDMKLINQPIDFYAQNIYQGNRIKAHRDGNPIKLPHAPGAPRTAIGWHVTPEALRWGPRFLYERYKLPIYITENGMSAHDAVSFDGKVHDPNRIEFLRQYLEQLSLSIKDGADVRGYFHWSFTDNFEWTKGYSERFGLVYVDFTTQKRTIKDSGYWYRDLIKSLSH